MLYKRSMTLPRRRDLALLALAAVLGLLAAAAAEAGSSPPRRYTAADQALARSLAAATAFDARRARSFTERPERYGSAAIT